MSKDERKRILEEMEKHGFPLEVEISSILNRRGWKVINQAYFKDEDTGKSRTVDLWSITRSEIDKQKYEFLHLSLIIECKKSEKPWVFYVTEKEDTVIFLNYWSPHETLGWGSLSHYNKEIFNKIAVIPFEPFKGERKKDILEASMQVIKATNFIKDMLIRHAKKIDPTHKALYVLYPIVVFDGHLWEYTLEKGRPIISETTYLQYLVEYGVKSQIIDIVQKNYFGSFLEKIEQEKEAITKKLRTV